MTIIAKPYKINPFDDLLAMNCDWADQLKDLVNERINEYQALITAEAAYDGQPELADETILYERFKENCNTGMWNGNWQILKYFIRVFTIKIFKDMIGQWEFTEHDAEMYNYFANLKVTEKTKCKAAALKCKSGAEPNRYLHSTDNSIN